MANYAYAILLSCMAGAATLIGSMLALAIRKTKACYLCLGMGFSAGVMIFLGFMELLNSSIGEIGYAPAILSFFLGMFLFYFLDVSIPHNYKAEHDSKYMRIGLLIFLGVAIHNFPEGMAVLFSTIADGQLGLSVAFALALHNIPEGLAISLPIYYATKSKAKAFTASALAAAAEPVGAIIGLMLLYPFIGESMIYYVLAAVGGIMVFISFDELLPLAFEYKSRHTVIVGIIAGMLLMALSMNILR